MALADFTPERIEVKFKGKALASVRGLSLEDLSVLVRTHIDDLHKLFEFFSNTGGKQTAPAEVFARMNEDGFVVKLVTELPLLAALTIALASDEPNAIEQARSLPLPLQVLIIRDIVRLTFEDVGGPKAFVALVNDLVRK